MNRDILLDLSADSHQWVREVVEDVPDDRWAEQPEGCPNHPAWTLAHLCGALDYARFVLGREPMCMMDFKTIAGPDTIPTADRSTYPSKDDLLAMFDRTHADLADAVRSATDAELAGVPKSIEGMSKSAGHFVSFMLVPHEAYHLGQLARWRHASGFGKS